jgi:hypothetical protein
MKRTFSSSFSGVWLGSCAMAPLRPTDINDTKASSSIDFVVTPCSFSARPSQKINLLDLAGVWWAYGALDLHDENMARVPIPLSIITQLARGNTLASIAMYVWRGGLAS